MVQRKFFGRIFPYKKADMEVGRFSGKSDYEKYRREIGFATNPEDKRYDSEINRVKREFSRNWARVEGRNGVKKAYWGGTLENLKNEKSGGSSTTFQARINRKVMNCNFCVKGEKILFTVIPLSKINAALTFSVDREVLAKGKPLSEATKIMGYEQDFEKTFGAEEKIKVRIMRDAYAATARKFGVKRRLLV